MKARYAFSMLVILAMAGVAAADQWIMLNPAVKPEPRGGFMMERVAGRIFLYGGRNDTATFRDLWEFVAAQDGMSGTWNKLSPSGAPPASSFVYASAVYGGKLYIFSGLDPSFQLVQGVWSYDPGANHWSQEPENGDVPAPRWGHRVSVIGDRAYMIGGQGAGGVPQGDVYSYEFPTGTWRLESWTVVSPSAMASGLSPAMGVYGHFQVHLGGADGTFPHDKIFVIGGMTASGPNQEFQVAIPELSQLLVQSVPSGFDKLEKTFAVAWPVGTMVYAGFGQEQGSATSMTTCIDLATKIQQQALFEGVVGLSEMDAPFAMTEGGGNTLAFVQGYDAFTIRFAIGGQRARATGLDAAPNPLAYVFFGGRDETGAFTDRTFLYETDESSIDPSPAQILSAAAHLKGRGGVFYSSLLHLFNVRSTQMDLHVVYTPRQDVGGAPQTTTVTIPARTMMVVDDPLAQWFGLGPNEKGVGTLMFYVDEGSPFDLLAQSIISAHNPDGTTFGQFLRAVMRRETVPENFAVRFPTTPDVEHNRVNFAVAALRDSQVHVRLLDSAGVDLAAAKSYALAVGESLQLNDVHQEFGVPYSDDAQVELAVDSGLVEGYESVLDGNQSYAGTSDPSSVGWSWSGGGTVAILEAGTVSGLNAYRGSGTLLNLGAAPVAVRADFYERGVPGAEATTMLNLGAHQAKGYQDLVGDLFGISGKVGTVVFTSQGNGTIAAAGREYAVYKDQQGVQTGTAGQYMRGLSQEDMLRPGSTYHVLGLKQTGTTAGKTRSHLTAMNPGSSDVTMMVTQYGAGGMEGQKGYTVRAGELKRINFILSDIVPSVDGGEKRLEITVDGPLWVQAFRVNDDGDPVTIDPFQEY